MRFADFDARLMHERRKGGDTMPETQSKYGGARVRFPPSLVFLGLIGAGVAVQRWLRPTAISLAFWPRVICGSAVALAGLLLIGAARVWFARTGQSPVPWKPSPELIVQGIYRKTRNPVYVGMTLFQLGLGAALDNPWISAFALIGLIVVHVIAIRPEERYLAQKFGESYLRYQKSVHRYI
jgi:protein-S-isoprenylcysteine O-methyltransferase Ste14